MIKHIPRYLQKSWLPIALSVSGSLGLLVFAVYLHNGSPLGYELIALGVVSTFFNVISIPLDRVRVEKASRLNVDLKLTLSHHEVPSFNGCSGFIERWVESERKACLESMTSNCGPHETIRPTKSPYIFPPSIPLPIGLGMFRRDNRSEEEFREEVEKYLSECRAPLESVLRKEYLRQKIAPLTITLSNNSDKPFEDVELTLRFSENAMVLLADVDEGEGDLPYRPPPFGKTTSISYPITKNKLPANMRRLINFTNTRAAHEMRKTDSQTVVYGSMTLRAREEKSLDGIHLLTRDLPGSIVTADWKATAMNANGHCMNTSKLVVGPEIDFSLVFSNINGRDRATFS